METTAPPTCLNSDLIKDFAIGMKEFRVGIQELREQMKETDQRMKEQMKENNHRKNEIDQMMQKQIEENTLRKREIDQQIKETGQLMKETGLRMKETDRKIGELSNRFGELAEHLVAPSIHQKFNELGFHFERFSDYTKIFDPDTFQTIAEVDILLENSESVVVVEVKAKPKEKHISEQIEKMEILRRLADQRQDTRKYYGAIAGAIMGDSIRAHILQSGFYTIEQTGDTVEITAPRDFTPRWW